MLMGWRGSGERGAALLTVPERFAGTRHKPWLSTRMWVRDVVSLWVPNQCRGIRWRCPKKASSQLLCCEHS